MTIKLSDISWSPPPPPPKLVERWQREAESSGGKRLSRPDAERLVYLRVALSRIPMRYRPTRQDAAKRTSAAMLADAERWQTRLSWLLTGPTGTGKSTAAGYALRARICAAAESPGAHPETQALCGLVWATAAALAAARAQHPLGRGDAPEVYRATIAPVLVVDDLGREASAQALADVLDARYDAGRPTVVTSGLRPAKMSDRYGAAITRRMTEGGAASITSSAWGGK